MSAFWSNRESDIISSDDFLDLFAAVYMYTKLHLSLQQRCPRNLTTLFVRRQPDDVPVLHSALYRPAGCCNSWDMNSRLSHPWPGWTSSASTSSCGSGSNRETPSTSSNQRLPRFPWSSDCHKPPPRCPIQSHLHPQPSWHGCLVGLCVSLVVPRLSRKAVSTWSVAQGCASRFFLSQKMHRSVTTKILVPNMVPPM